MSEDSQPRRKLPALWDPKSAEWPGKSSYAKWENLDGPIIQFGKTAVEPIKFLTKLLLVRWFG